MIVQDFARNDFELRQFVVHGKVENRVYSNFIWTDADGYLRDFIMKDRSEAVTDWMAGDEPAMAMAERKATKLVKAWVTWLATQSAEVVPALRMDMLIKHTGPGTAEVFTLELTELGFSMLTWPDGPPTVFGEHMRTCTCARMHVCPHARVPACTCGTFQLAGIRTCTCARMHVCPHARMTSTCRRTARVMLR